jgi:hypothetical protein
MWKTVIFVVLVLLILNNLKRDKYTPKGYNPSSYFRVGGDSRSKYGLVGHLLSGN